MCGIVAYIGSKKITPLLLDGLKKLEYRGYDSAGLCVLDSNKLKIVKRKGKIAELEKHPQIAKLEGNIGIAHTRWATHGRPNMTNAHPHCDCKKEIAIVHNGIIENYHSLRELLEREGHKIKSQTDSEIVAHLIEKFYQGNLEEAVREALKLVEGAYGLAVMHKNEDKIIAARLGSPLILGVGNGEMLVASDALPVLNHTKKVVYLEDKQIATVTANNYIIKNINGDPVLNHKVFDIAWKVSQIEKGGFKHFMLKEIFEQPKAIGNTLRGRIKKANIKLTIDVNPNSIRRIIIVACGTSWHAGLIGKYIIEKNLGIPAEVDYASEFRYRNPPVSKKDLVIVISQSGETADTLAALRGVKSKGAKTLGIVNVVGSTVAREVDSGIYLHAGPEIGVASTKAFTCQITALILLTLYIMQKQGKPLDFKFLKKLAQLPQKVQNALELSDQIRKVGQKLKDAKSFLFLGRGINFPVALEGALKLKEISYIHAEGYPAAEMKHGPIALIEKEVPSVFLATRDHLYQKVLSNMQEVKARGGKIVALVNGWNKELEKLVDFPIEVPKVPLELTPIVNVISLQLLAYHISDLKGIDMDKPRNLAKSVTVE